MKHLNSRISLKGLTVSDGTVVIGRNAPLLKDTNLQIRIITDEGQEAVLIALNEQGALYRIVDTNQTIIMPIQTSSEQFILNAMLGIAVRTRDTRAGLRETLHLAA